ncbi:MAG: DUF429 domain-containing protein [Candidatus Micrarchaeia archaeon]
MVMASVIGIDLAGSERRDTGVTVISNGKIVYTGIVHRNGEILSLVKKHKAGLVAIDAPLTLPRGRLGINDSNGPHFRECDLKLREMKIRFFPVTLGPMRMLTSRGILLAQLLANELNCRAIEVYPGASYDLLGVPRRDYAGIIKAVRALGYHIKNRVYTRDEIDSIMCAVVGDMEINGVVKSIGGADGCIYVPGYYHTHPNIAIP